MRVLLVDNDAQAAATIQRALKANGAILEHVETGEEAFQLAKRYDYDAMILDLMLPDIDGYEVIRRLRWTSVAVPILVLSSLTRPQAKVKAFSARMISWRDPWTNQNLGPASRRWCAGPKASATPRSWSARSFWTWTPISSQ